MPVGPIKYFGKLLRFFTVQRVKICDNSDIGINCHVPWTNEIIENVMMCLNVIFCYQITYSTVLMFQRVNKARQKIKNYY